MKVTVNTSDKSTVYTKGEYPVGHITQVIKQYVMKAEVAKSLLKSMRSRIKELENEHGENDISNELKNHLIKAQAWYEPKTVWEWDFDGQSEVDMQLRHAPNQKLSGKGL